VVLERDEPCKQYSQHQSLRLFHLQDTFLRFDPMRPSVDNHAIQGKLSAPNSVGIRHRRLLWSQVRNKQRQVGLGMEHEQLEVQSEMTRIWKQPLNQESLIQYACKIPCSMTEEDEKEEDKKI
jgi:hypothetical protein